LRAHMARVDERAAMLKSQVPADAFLFSPDPDGATPLIPDSVSQRYERLVKRLGIDTTLHKLRHYNATELIAAGVDLRTIAGRLGHGGVAPPPCGCTRPGSPKPTNAQRQLW